MKLKAVSGIVLTLMFISMLTLAFNIQIAEAERTTWTVDDDGPADFSKIQDAIDAASPGDKIYVYNGIYYENVVVNKSISLVGENRSTTVIDGDGTGNVIGITADHVNVTGFTIGNGMNGIFIEKSDYNVISGNIVTDNQQGIQLFATCTCNPASENTIRNNIIKNNSIGIRLKISTVNVIFHNNFINNTQQVYIGYLPYDYANFWDNGYPSGGNYWSDYTGIDVKSGPNQDQPSSDGIGDIPYIIDEDNRDNYPLIYPWDASPPPSYILTVHSSLTGVTFTVDDVSRTTPWSGTYSEGASVSLVMPETSDGYTWSHWLENGDTNRTKTVTMNTNITLTAQYGSSVGGVWISPNKLELLSSYIALATTIILTTLTTAVFVKRKKKKQ